MAVEPLLSVQDLSVAFRRDAGGRVAGVTVGCWLARGLDYPRVA